MALNVRLVNGRKTPLHVAVEKKDAAMLATQIQRARERHEDIDVSGGMYGETPLMYAVYKNKGWAEGARMLIEAGADVDATKGMNRTPLMIAGEFNRVEIAQALLDAGADATIRYIDGRTASGWAKQYGHAALESTLLEVEDAQHARIRAKGDEHQRAALLLAAGARDDAPGAGAPQPAAAASLAALSEQCPDPDGQSSREFLDE